MIYIKFNNTGCNNNTYENHIITLSLVPYLLRDCEAQNRNFNVNFVDCCCINSIKNYCMAEGKPKANGKRKENSDKIIFRNMWELLIVSIIHSFIPLVAYCCCGAI